jgi:hypothetical protein
MRVSWVASATAVTSASARTPPEVSVMVPVMPPRVCCGAAWSGGRSVRPQQSKEEKKTQRTLSDGLVIPRRLQLSINTHEPGRLREADQARILQRKSVSPRLATPVCEKVKGRYSKKLRNRNANFRFPRFVFLFHPWERLARREASGDCAFEAYAGFRGEEKRARRRFANLRGSGP